MAWIGAVRTRLLGRALGWTWLVLLILVFGSTGLALVLDSGGGPAKPGPWLGALLVGASGLAGLLTIAWLGLRLRASPSAALQRLRKSDAPLAEEVTSALELSSHPPRNTDLGDAFVRCHRQEVERQLHGVSPADLVPMTGVAPLGRLAALLSSALVLALAVVPEAPERLWSSLGMKGGSDSLPIILSGPAARPLRMELRPPGYTGIPPSIRAPTDVPTLVPEGSQVTVLLEADHPVEGIRALSPRGQLLEGDRLGEKAIRVRFTAQGKGELLLALQDPQGVWRVGARGPAFRLQRDRPPSVTLRPDDPVFRLETAETLTFSWKARDDHGLTSVRLVYAVDGGKPTRVELSQGPRFGPSRRLDLSGEHRWDLTSLGLGAGSHVRFHVEAEDNRSLPAVPTGSQTASSPSQEIRIEGSRQARRDMLGGVRKLLGATLDALASRYEHPWHRATPENCAEALQTLERQQGQELALSTRLSAFLQEAGAAPQVLPPLLLEVFQGPLAKLSRRLEATTRADRRLRPKTPACHHPGPAARVSGQVVETLEELALQLDALTGRATLEEMKDVVERIQALRQEIRRLAENLQKRPEEGTRKKLAEQTSELRRQMARLSRLAGTLGDEVLDEHVNQYALQQQKPSAILDQIGKQGPGHHDPLNALDRMVSQLQQAVSQGIDRFRQVIPIPGEVARQRMAQGLRALAETQRHLEEALQKAKDPRALVDQQRELAAKAKRMAENRPSENAQGTRTEIDKRGRCDGDTLGEVARRMDEAAEALERGARESARQKTSEARRTLDTLRQALERAGRLTPSPGEAGHGMDDRGAVKVPSPGGVLPRELRESIQEAGRVRWPRPYSDSLRRYYERLLR